MPTNVTHEEQEQGGKKKKHKKACEESKKKKNTLPVKKSLPSYSPLSLPLSPLLFFRKSLDCLAQIKRIPDLAIA
jgi:hypothetical protein